MDQINNLQGGSPKPISRPIPQSKAQNPTEDANKAELSFEALISRLQEMPEVRADAIKSGKELADKPDYPEDKMLRTLAQNLIAQRIV